MNDVLEKGFMRNHPSYGSGREKAETVSGSKILRTGIGTVYFCQVAVFISITQTGGNGLITVRDRCNGTSGGSNHTVTHIIEYHSVDVV